ncbi:MAG: hypothetical protein KC656_15570 [Myxococcales bacterium]|nr:hypothetical protein [Myxococcales bacterium]
MRVATALLLGLAAPSIALACPGKGDTTTASAHVDAASPDAASCAKKAALVGSACSYSTGMMASRVLEQGKDFTYTGTLRKADEPLASKVAAPYTVGPDSIRVIANEVVETASPDARTTWTGKTLEVDGVRYFVVTGFEKVSV